MYNYFQLTENCIFKSNEWEFINLVYIENTNIKESLSEYLKVLPEVENIIINKNNILKENKTNQDNESEIKIEDWKDLSLTFQSETLVDIYDKKRNILKTRNYEDLKFKNTKNTKTPAPLNEWNILLFFCVNKGILNYDLIVETQKKYNLNIPIIIYENNMYFRKQISLLNKN